MKVFHFNNGWEFTLENAMDEFNTFGFDKYSDAAGAAARFYDNNNWEKVDLPHDWALTLPRTPQANTFAGAFPNTRFHRFCLERHSDVGEVFEIGWYRKSFAFDPSWEGKRVWIEFEGIFRDAVVWVNGVYLDRHTSGYTGFALELTDHLYQNEVNSVAVRVDSRHAEGWWYEGAGIYRNVNLLVGEPTYFAYHKTAVHATVDGRVQVRSVIVNDTAQAAEADLSVRVLDGQGAMVAQTQTRVAAAPYADAPLQVELSVESPLLWSVDAPHLYTLELQLGQEVERIGFGFRSVAFDANRGLLLNGKPIKVRGACVHQDFGGVGVALSDNLNEYKIRRLKQMGVNAYRCSHHAPSPALLDACDRLGMLVMDETRTFGTSPEAMRQLTDLIERDRNHPCVFIWALGNEEFSVQNDPQSFRLMEKMTRAAKALDPTRPVTYAGNNGANFIGANGASEVRGVNYIRNDKTGYWLDEYHKAHPDQPIIGTEEASNVLSRGGAVNALGDGRIDSTGNVTMAWGSTPKGWVKYTETRDYFAGSFMWTGFDYRGEPNPFYYANNASSFGTIDLCGMEKPPFYYYKAWWTDESVLKLTPHWNHSQGQEVTVAVFTNCEQITLYLNGREIETRRVERFDAPLFTLPFEAGVLTVEGVRGDERLSDSLVTAGEIAQVRCERVLEAKTARDIAIYQLEAYDAQGRLCPLADATVALSVENGRIVGVGNGDPSDYSPEQQREPDEVKELYTLTYEGRACPIPDKARNEKRVRYDWIEREEKQPGFEDDFRLVARFVNNPEPAQTKEYTAVFDGVQDYEYIEFERLGSETEVYLNGEKIGDNLRWHGRQTKNANRPYRFYATFRKGENELRLVCRCEHSDPPAVSGYLRLGRRVEADWRVRLHYGKARVFVRSTAPQALSLSAKLHK